MPPHLISCLEKGHFTPFPQNTTSSTDFVKIFARRIECSCQCGKPDVFENMIGREAKRGRISCTKWVHQTCSGVSEDCKDKADQGSSPFHNRLYTGGVIPVETDLDSQLTFLSTTTELSQQSASDWETDNASDRNNFNQPNKQQKLSNFKTSVKSSMG
ncbi:unnamed protein product [Mytilus coruscus]|uniref:Uncharacterized protein n=1 Tax=Mytilus coruscus TaxID=42192 RepID=A0A6J8B3D5_MYTCO|nr:unnamed protein product [Mytilus coruscus]